MIEVEINSVWPMEPKGSALASCTCGWEWEEEFYGPVEGDKAISARASADQLKMAISDHEYEGCR